MQETFLRKGRSSQITDVLLSSFTPWAIEVWKKSNKLTSWNLQEKIYSCTRRCCDHKLEKLQTIYYRCLENVNVQLGLFIIRKRQLLRIDYVKMIHFSTVSDKNWKVS